MEQWGVTFVNLPVWWYFQTHFSLKLHFSGLPAIYVSCPCAFMLGTPQTVTRVHVHLRSEWAVHASRSNYNAPVPEQSNHSVSIERLNLYRLCEAYAQYLVILTPLCILDFAFYLGLAWPLPVFLFQFCLTFWICSSTCCFIINTLPALTSIFLPHYEAISSTGTKPKLHFMDCNRYLQTAHLWLKNWKWQLRKRIGWINMIFIFIYFNIIFGAGLSCQDTLEFKGKTKNYIDVYVSAAQ